MTRPTLASPWSKVAAIALTLGLVAGCSMSPMRTGADPAEVSKLKAAAARSTTGLVNVVVTHGNAKNLTELVSAGFDVWGVEGNKVKGSANAASLDAIQRLNLPVESFRSLGNSFDKGYKTTEQIEADLKALAAKYPEMTKLEDFGDSWEKSQGKTGHDLFVLKIGRGNTASKPGVIYLGNHHAREIVTPEIVLNIAHMLLEGYGKDPEITAYVDSRDIWLAPTVNPDGHVHAENGANQRKNTNIVTGGKRRIGVDLNRNYGYKWNNGGSSADPESDTFMGVGAFSEPETQAIKKLVGSRKFAFLMTYHSFSNLILWPWGYSDAPPPDKRLPAIGMKLGALSGYKPQQSKDLYKTSGDTTDWAFGELGILAYTSEIGSWGDNFDPPYSKMAQFWNENRPGALYLLKLADNPDAVFGPALTQVQVAGGQVQVQASAPIAQVETFVGQAGAPGTGTKVRAQGTKAALALPSSLTESRQVVMVRAQGTDGKWGPAEAVWSR